jgi:WD40 repeat protein
MDGFPLAIAWNPKSGLLAAGSADGEIDVWNLSTAEPAQQFQHPFVFSGVTSLLFGSDGSQLISEGDGKVVVWDWAAGTALKTMEGDGPMSLSPSGQELVTGWYSSATAKTTIRIFDLARLGSSSDIRPRFVQPNMMDRTIKAAFTQSGSQILILASNGAEWWDTQTLQFQGSTDVLKLISEKTDAFSPIGAVTSGGLVLTEPGIGVSIAGFPLPLLSLGPATCGFALWDPVHAGAYAIPASSGPCESAIAAGDSHRVVLSSDDRVLAADDGAGDLRVWSVDPSAAVVAPICLGDCGGS